MADLSVIKPRYRELVKKLFPPGEIWKVKFGSLFDGLIDAIAAEPARVEGRALDFMDEINPARTFEMLDNWERLLALPDECTPDDAYLSISDRRVRVIQKLATGGGQSKSFFKLIAKQLGYDADAFDVKNYRDFRAGYGMAGEPISNSSGGWTFAFEIRAPATTSKQFRAGQSVAGDPLNYVANETLECVMRKFAPAHTTVVFSYIE